MLNFLALGPLEVWDGHTRVALGGRRQELLVGALLLDAGRVLSVDGLVEVLWGAGPPRTAVGQIRDRVRRLRGVLGADLARYLVTRQGGYCLDVPDEACDLRVFDRRLDRARAARDAGAADEAAAAWAAALGLWRGRPLSGLDSPAFDSAVTRWEERRLTAVEDWAEVELARGRHRDLVADLAGHVAEHPLRERLRGGLVLALYRSGRHADALAECAEARRVAWAELGVEPGPALRDLERAMTTGDPSIDVPAAAPVPRQLPPDTARLVGRTTALARITGGTLTLVTGPAGVGKTTLAVHAAHRIRDRHPGGELFANLGGGLRRVDPGDVQRRFLHALGAPSVPGDPEERTALYRSTLADRRLVVLLDDAADEAQVRPLLVGAGSAVIVTSRSRLPGLTSADVVELSPMDLADAVDLLAAVVGRDRVAADPGAAAALAGYCGHLPLALRTAAARLLTRPRWSLADLAARLAGERDRLDVLAAGDLTVRASLGVSYEGLDPAAATTLRRLARLGVPAAPAWIAHALLDAPAEAVLDALADAHLLDVDAPDGLGRVRYRLHDLVRLYAAERSLAEDSPTDWDAAARRVLGGWLAQADRQPPVFLPALPPVAPRWPAPQTDPAASPGTPAPPATPPAVPVASSGRPVAPADPDRVAWYEAERESLLATVRNVPLPAVAELIYQVSGLLSLRSDWPAWREAAESTLALLRGPGDRRAEGRLLCVLGELLVHLSDLAPAREHLERAVAVLEETGDRHLVGYALDLLGVVTRMEQDLPAAEGLFRAALRTMTRHADRSGAGHVRHDLAVLRYRQGRPGEAARYLRRALEDHVAAGAHDAAGHCWFWLARIHRERGDLAGAERSLVAGAAEFRTAGDLRGTALVGIERGRLLLDRGEYAPAGDELDRALAVFRADGDRRGQAMCLRVRGEIRLRAGRPADARRDLDAALALCETLGNPGWLAEVRDLLAEVDAGGVPIDVC
ncbi:BTAD domain-containing putative transcriptional regulator [Longispora sp. K20-0274]|uniref:AfsR/SARP family transcriptional regulator n=1 Tax=Longispora sp. K20-0274 TaxID=3088255 RepID=UPI00399A7E75